MKILVAVDGSPCSMAAVEELCRRPWPADSVVQVVCVDRPVEQAILRAESPTLFDEIVQQQRTLAINHMNDAAKLIRECSPQLEVETVLLEGWPKQAIVDQAEHWGADLILVGAHGYGVIQRFFLGSVSLAVATNARCSVQIVRAKKSETPSANS